MNDLNTRRVAAQCRRLIEWCETADEAVAQGQPLDEWLAGQFRKHRECGSRDRRLIKDALFSYFRWRGWLLQREEIEYAEALLWAHVLDADPLTPLAEELAAAAQMTATAWAAMGPASLAEKADYLQQQGGFPGGLGAAALVPDWVPDLLPAANRAAWLASFQSRPPTWLRFRSEPRSVEAVAHPLLTEAGCLAGAISREWLQGGRADFVVQDLASQCVGRIATPQPGDTWWDACAGAGGKTLHLADLMLGQGRIFATDTRSEVIADLKRRATAAGCSDRITAMTQDARSWLPGLLCDGVLVDAPCSGLGTWSRNPDARWRTDAKSIVRAAKRQRALLDHAAKAVRPGGTLVYAVCTVTMAETEALAHAFSEQQRDFEAADFVHPLTADTCSGTCYIEPWQHSCGAMFVARWRRKS